MKKKELKVIILGGAGMEGRLFTKYLTQRGATVVAGTGRSNHIGEDLGELAGIGKLGVLLEKSDQLDAILERTKPDIAIDCTDSLEVIAPNIRKCVKHHVNVVMLTGEGYFAAKFNPELFAEIDNLAKQNGVSVIGLGVQDVNWSNECLIFSGNCHSIKSMYAENLCLLEYTGPMELEMIGLGLTEAEYYERFKDDLNPRNYFVFGLYQIADEMGLKVTEEVNHRRVPLLAEKDVPAREIGAGDFLDKKGGIIPKGCVVGQSLVTELHTAEGISLSGNFIWGAIYNGHSGSYQLWKFDAEPAFEVFTPDSRGDLGTSADVINRLADVINARPGFISTTDLPKPYFKSKPLAEYLKS